MHPNTSSTVTPRQDLSELTYDYMTAESRGGFIGMRVFPVYNVMESAGVFPWLPLEQLLKMPESLERNEDGSFQRGRMKYDSKSYSTVDRGYEEKIDSRDVKLVESWFDAEAITNERALDVVLRVGEKRIADKVDNTTVPAGRTQTASAVWTNHATADPRGDWFALVDKVKAAHGVMLNTIQLSWARWRDLILNEKLIESVKYTGGRPLEQEPLSVQTAVAAAYLAVDEVLVGDAQIDTANRAKAASLSYVWSDQHVNGFCLSASQDITRPSFGRTFVWSRNSGAGMHGTSTETYFEDRSDSNMVRVRHDVDENVIHSQCLGRIDSVV